MDGLELGLTSYIVWLQGQWSIKELIKTYLSSLKPRLLIDILVIHNLKKSLCCATTKKAPRGAAPAAFGACTSLLTLL